MAVDDTQFVSDNLALIVMRQVLEPPPIGDLRGAASNDRFARVWSATSELASQTIPMLTQRLREINIDCLPAALRRTYLREADADAKSGYKRCERERGRFPPEDAPQWANRIRQRGPRSSSSTNS